MPILYGPLGVALMIFCSVWAGRRGPQYAFAALWAIILLVPYWVGLQLGVEVSGFLIAILAVLVGLASRRGFRFRWSGFDTAMVALVTISGAASLAGESGVQDALVVLVAWAAAYFVGRHIGLGEIRRLGRVMRVAVILLALLSIVEFGLSWFPFVDAAPGSRAFYVWSPIQFRGGVSRSEWTTGHSIALGGLVSMGLPWVMGTVKSNGMRIFVLAVGIGGVMVTFSRIAIISLVLGIGLWIATQKRARLKWTVLCMVGSAAALIVSRSVFAAGADEVAASGEARLTQLELLRYVRPFGAAGNAVIADAGRTAFAAERGVFRSVDNAVTLAALQFGWIFAGIFIALLVAVLILGLRRRSLAGICVVALTPSLFAVALITHLGPMYWILVGVAVSARDWRKRGSLTRPIRTGVSTEGSEKPGCARGKGNPVPITGGLGSTISDF